MNKISIILKKQGLVCSRFLFSAVALLLIFFTFSSCSVFRSNAQGKRNKSISKDSVNVIFMNAMQDLMLEKNEAAFEKFNEVIKYQPGNATAHYQLSRLWFEKSNLPKAIKEIQLAEKYDPSNKWILEHYAQLMIVDGRFEKAAELYGRIAKNERSPEEFLAKQALSYTWANRFGSALRVLNELEKYTTEFDENLQFQKARLFLELKEVDSAIAITRSLIDHAPQNPNYMLLLGRIYFDRGNFSEALKSFKEADRKFPDEPQVQASLIYYYLKEDKTALHDYLYDVIIERDGLIENKISLLNVFNSSRSTDTLSEQVIKEFAPLLSERQPAEAESMIFYGMVLSAEKQDDSAAFQFKRAIAVDSLNLDAWGLLFPTLVALDTSDSIVEYASRALALFPENPVFNYYGAYGYFLAKDYANAIPVLEDGLLKLTAQDTFLALTFHSFLGDSYQEVKDFNKADSSYSSALAIDSGNVGVLNNYSYFLAQQNTRLDEAESMSAITIKTHPDEASFLDTYGWILYKKGNFKEAKKYVERAIKNSEERNSGVMYEHLGDIEFKLGNERLALEHWLKAKEEGEHSELLLEKIATKKLHE